MRVKTVVLSLGLWLAAAQGFAAQACCGEMPTPRAACDGCGAPGDRESSPRPDCCTSLEAQKDVDAVVPRNDLPENPIIVALLTEDTSFAPSRPETTDVVAREVSSRAEGPPLYLRYEVFLI